MAPSTAELEQLCTHLSSSDQSPFFDRVSPEVVWDVLGVSLPATRQHDKRSNGHKAHIPLPDTSQAFRKPLIALAHPESWKEGALGVINKVLREPLRMKVINAISGGDQSDWAVVELEANSVCKNGLYAFRSEHGAGQARLTWAQVCRTHNATPGPCDSTTRASLCRYVAATVASPACETLMYHAS
ncbi:hypothetical protein BAUCODRAFT_20765 [Baudoinia panamericana UAMH 10762]|uniref:Uncharacterized protein n=1 Tax=Baudoinia panamericana (strain UAMH 10762) TaxID=717646 RepID=M2MUU6_BAUPA|nr:uncharacterized protein BAUCODRAFT_20765 [Baudoinia panamericana UAMH 10762]EMD00717.1 hypothetical protein BAUCODRAFT_20765 [Baudoinia panamericana UAMH 10762]